MNRRDWNYLRIGAWAILAVTTTHGVTSKGWRDLHTFGVLLSVVAIAGTTLAD